MEGLSDFPGTRMGQTVNARWKALFILLCAIVVGVRGDWAPAVQAAPTSIWAVISSRELQSTGVPDLVFLRLAELDGIELVERDDYQAVLAESELAAIGGAASVGQRVQLGQRTAADVLMILDIVRAARAFDWDTQGCHGEERSRAGFAHARASACPYRRLRLTFRRPLVHAKRRSREPITNRCGS